MKTQLTDCHDVIQLADFGTLLCRTSLSSVKFEGDVGSSYVVFDSAPPQQQHAAGITFSKVCDSDHPCASGKLLLQYPPTRVPELNDALLACPDGLDRAFGPSQSGGSVPCIPNVCNAHAPLCNVGANSSSTSSKKWRCGDGSDRQYVNKQVGFCQVNPRGGSGGSADDDKTILGAVVGALMACALCGLFYYVRKDRAKFQKLFTSFMQNEVTIAVSIGLELWDFGGDTIVLIGVLGNDEEAIAGLRTPFVIAYAVSVLVALICFYTKIKIFVGFVRHRRVQFAVDLTALNNDYTSRHQTSLDEIMKQVRMVLASPYCAIFYCMHA